MHIEVCLTLLRKKFAKIEIEESQPIVSYRETVTLNQDCSIMCSKSPNKLNRIIVQGSSLDEKLVEYIEEAENIKKVT